MRMFLHIYTCATYMHGHTYTCTCTHKHTHTEITLVSSWALPCKWGSAGGRVPCAVLVARWWPWGDWGGEWTGPTESTLSHWNAMSCVTSMYTADKNHPHSQNVLTVLGMEKRMYTQTKRKVCLGSLVGVLCQWQWWRQTEKGSLVMDSILNFGTHSGWPQNGSSRGHVFVTFNWWLLTKVLRNWMTL